MIEESYVFCRLIYYCPINMLTKLFVVLWLIFWLQVAEVGASKLDFEVFKPERLVYISIIVYPCSN